jgi:hypothetical protein
MIFAEGYILLKTLIKLGSYPGKDKIFPPLHNVQTFSGAHPASYPTGTGGDFPGGRGAGA